MTREIEHIFKNKRYLELDSHERSIVSEYAKNEEEYEGMRALLLQINQVVQDVHEVPPTIKTRLDQLFDQKFAVTRLAWYNRLWLFLWPDQTRIIQRPALQLAMLLTLVVLIIGLFPKLEQEQLAVVTPDGKEKVKPDDSSTSDDEIVLELRKQQVLSETNNSDDKRAAATENILVNTEMQREEMETFNGTRAFSELRSDKDDVLLPTPIESIALEEELHPSFGNVSEPISEVVMQDSERTEKISKRITTNSKTVDVLDLLTALY
jgi:hypothetical protein